MDKQVQILIDQSGPTTSTAKFRGHCITVDRPREKNGADRGPMGGELILVGLGGCFTSNLLAAIRSRQLDISQISTTVTATLADSPSRFASIDMAVSASGSDDNLLQELVTTAERSCLAANTLRGGGVRLTIHVTPNEPLPTHPAPFH